jgi:hypothetical protein
MYDMFDIDVQDELARIAMENPGKLQLTAPANRAYYSGLELDEPVSFAAAEQGEALEAFTAEGARDRMLTAARFDDMLAEFSGGFRDPDAKAWALFMLDDLRVGEQVINLAGECVQLADASGGDSAGVRAGVRRSPLSTPDRITRAWSHLHHPKNAAKYTDAQLSTLKAKLRTLARQHGVELDDDDMGNVPGAENQGNQGPKPRPGKHHTRPDQIRRRGQYPSGEGGGPDGGSGASGGEMAASTPRGYSRGFMKLAQDAADGDPAAIVLLANRDAKNYRAVVGPFESGTTQDMVRHFDFDVDDVGARDDGDPTDDRSHDEIVRLLAKAAGLFAEKPISGNQKGKRAGKYPGTGPSGKPQTAGR